MELLTCGEFARAYNISISKVRDMCQKGELPALKIGVGWRINRERAEDVLSSLFEEKVAQKTAERSKTKVFRAKPRQNFDFLAELSRARGKLNE